MYLEKEDWEEPMCCFRPNAAAKELHAGQSGRSVHEVIREYDRLIALDAGEDAGRFLEFWQETFESGANWAAQITILNEMMGFYRNAGEAAKGLAASEKGIALIREHGMAETVSGGTTFLNAATTMKAFGKVKEAMPFYEEAFRAYGNSLDPSDYRFGSLFNNMALAWEDQGDYRKAEVYYRKAMEIMEALRPGSILEIAVTWVNLAVLYEKWGQDEKIDDCLERAICEFRSEDVLHDGYYAFNCRKCAKTFDHFGYFRMKKELLDEADRIYGENRRAL